ncbi:NADH-quinone oxidoreductase subunit C [Streptomyces sp. 3214.6]|uniref:NADH-quinone oxidoreductase subunit C n=1 Tax=Streptomyces sp. 3214.6 TaxID=1882757 RepID=UPI00090974F4|nr:NADH-quinone oxidoreductase subunit C [Streptomyces sp. 3214.6]SHI06981.1 NADH dehydrogenase subunit C [Streptomyces sp. 3214.6]
MSTVGWLPAPAEELFGPQATAEESYDVLTVDVLPTSWTAALRVARDRLSCTYFDWLSAVDEPGTGFRVSAHLVALSPVRRLLVRTTIPHEAPTLASAVDVYAGAAWHERETHEMFGVTFEGHPALNHLLLPETFEGHPLRKDFVLAARVAKAWPGAKEPGESEHGGPKRRQMLPPGVPDPNEWGPLKGQLPPAPARPTRAAAGRPAGDRPVRRARTTAEGSASQTPTPTPPTEPTATPPTGPRRARSATTGSASQRAAGPEPASAVEAGEAAGAAGAAEAGPTAPEPTPQPPAGPRRARSASQGSASQRPQPPTTSPGTPTRPATPHRSSDAPWHHARPAFDEPKPDRDPDPEPNPERQQKPQQKPDQERDQERDQEPEPEPGPDPEFRNGAEPQPEPRNGVQPVREPEQSRAEQSATGGKPAPVEETERPAPDDPAGGQQ